MIAAFGLASGVLALGAGCGGSSAVLADPASLPADAPVVPVWVRDTTATFNDDDVPAAVVDGLRRGMAGRGYRILTPEEVGDLMVEAGIASPLGIDSAGRDRLRRAIASDRLLTIQVIELRVEELDLGVATRREAIAVINAGEIDLGTGEIGFDEQITARASTGDGEGPLPGLVAAVERLAGAYPRAPEPAAAADTDASGSGGAGS